MRVTIDGVAYVVTEKQVQRAFELLDLLIPVELKGGYGHKDAVTKLYKGLALAKSRGRPKGTSTFDLKRATQLRKQGQTYDEIAAELGCSARTVIRKLKGTP